MREVRTTEARARLAELLRAVERGEIIAITRHGKTVAHLTPAPDERAARREAVRRFRAQRRRWRRIEATTEEICAWRRQGRR